jgi:thiol-disulfide isomerase/thioredoxin
MKKSILAQVVILGGTLVLNTGCFFGIFEDPVVPTERPTMTTKPVATTTKQRTAPVQVTFPRTAPAVECTNDLNSACNKGRISASTLKPKIKTQAGGEIHRLKSYQGHPITIIERSNGFIFPQYKNKTVILEMFGKNCSHCIKEIPVFNQIRRDFKGKVEIIAVQVEDSMSPLQAKSLIRRYKLSYPLIDGETATNLQYSIQHTYGWTGILPYIMVIKNGVTEVTYPGEVSYSELKNDLQGIVQ